MAFGVLLDIILVRSLLIPALAYDIGPRIWWPSKLGRPENDRGERSLPSAPEPETEPVSTKAGIR